MSVQLEIQIKSMTVREAVISAYNQMPEVFSALTLCLTVRSLQNKMTMDGTILRRLRELREENNCNYKVINSAKAIYKKIIKTKKK